MKIFNKCIFQVFLFVSFASAHDQMTLMQKVELTTAIGRVMALAANYAEINNGPCVLPLHIATDVFRVSNGFLSLWNKELSCKNEASYYAGAWMVYDVINLLKHIGECVDSAPAEKVKNITKCGPILPIDTSAIDSSDTVSLAELSAVSSDNELSADKVKFEQIITGDSIEDITKKLHNYVLPMIETGSAICVAWNNANTAEAARLRVRVQSLGSLARLLAECLKQDFSKSETHLYVALLLNHIILTAHEFLRTNSEQSHSDQSNMSNIINTEVPILESVRSLPLEQKHEEPEVIHVNLNQTDTDEIIDVEGIISHEEAASGEEKVVVSEIYKIDISESKDESSREDESSKELSEKTSDYSDDEHSSLK